MKKLTLLILIFLFGQSDSVTLQSLSGQPVALSALKGKIVVLAFSGSWIPLVARELDSLQRLAERYESREVQVFWVAINGDKPESRHYASNEDLRALLKRQNLRLEILRDPAMEAYHAFDLKAIPTLLLLDREGQVAGRYVGIGTGPGEVYSEIRHDIEGLLAK